MARLGVGLGFQLSNRARPRNFASNISPHSQHAKFQGAIHWFLARSTRRRQELRPPASWTVGPKRPGFSVVSVTRERTCSC
jgi:hypothetical protein